MNVTREMVDEYVCVGACAACMGEGLNCAACNGTGRHDPAQPGAHWPNGFRERAQAAADRVAAERHRSSALATTLLAALALSTVTPDDPGQKGNA